MNTLQVTVGPNGLARIEMARPEVFNAFDERMIAELTQAFAALGANPAVRSIVLCGQGKAFSAGADLQWMKRASVATEAENLDDARSFANMLSSVALCSKPTIACVHGVALGGGVGLAAACDFVIASPDASFGVTEVKFGILPSVIGPYLVNAVGKRQALRLALSAARVGAADALSIGLVHLIVPREDFEQEVVKLATGFAQNGPEALGEVKKLYATLGVGPVSDQVREMTARTIARVRMTDEAKEGFNAFLEKRPAKWIPPQV